MNPSLNYAVSVIVETPDGIPLVSDPKKPIPRYWKFPGGRGETGETPAETAARELKEETGIEIEAEDLTLLHSEERADHNFFLFHAKLASPVSLLGMGSEGENVRFFKNAEIDSMLDFFPNHRALALKFLSKD
jgi:ADP-ribose pyrophosphatase YjhB (NUDIX family)